MIQTGAMANFSDQFEKRDPLTFTAFGIFDLWPRQIAWEARDLLEGRPSPLLKEIAISVEMLIEVQTNFMVSKQGRRGDPRFDSNPKAIGFGNAHVIQNSEQLRLQHGDVNLFVAATSLPEARQFKFMFWEGLAVLALWKLIDFFETIFAPQKEIGYEIGLPRATKEKRHSALNSAVPDLVEAMRACTLAGEAKMRLQQLAAMKSSAQREVSTALYEAEAQRRSEVSEKSRAAVMVRHSKTSAHQAEALRLAYSKPFKSRAEAARHAAYIVEKGPNTYYTVAVVDGWLKAAGWRKDGVSTA